MLAPKTELLLSCLSIIFEKHATGADRYVLSFFVLINHLARFTAKVEFLALSLRLRLKRAMFDIVWR